MPGAKFSEFSYAFAITNAIYNMFGSYVPSAPYFPSLNQETSFDIAFQLYDLSLFLQFKTSHYVESHNSEPWKKLQICPCYRFKTYSRLDSLQHDNLVDLAGSEPHVYYCAPLFYSYADFNSNFLNGTLLSTSVLIPCSQLPKLPDDDEHSIVYEDSTQAHFYSKPIGIKPIYLVESRLNEIIARAAGTERKAVEPMTLQRLLTLTQSMESVVTSNWESLPSDRRGRIGPLRFPEFNKSQTNQVVRAIGDIARTHFGAQWIPLFRVTKH